jgi:RNA polymerase sigma-70 factor, ECF subfamily
MDLATREINLELIRQAQAGSAEDTSRLTEVAREKVFTYTFRLTFDHHLSQDLTQDTMVEMLRSLSKLQFDSVPAFWAWTYKTALTRVRRHFRPRGSTRPAIRTGVDLDKLARTLPVTPDAEARDLIREELLHVVLKAMHTMRLEHRNVLTLRCMDGLSYAQIASIEGGTELGARLRFFKARKALKRDLARQGFDRSYLAYGLGLLTAVTAIHTGTTATAAAAVSIASIQIGPVTAALGLLVSKWTVLVTGIAAALALALIVITPNSPRRDLVQLVRSGGFAFPSAVLGFGPQQDGSVHFQTRPADPHARREISAAQWLESMATDGQARAVLTPGSWIELRFPGPIQNGPGPDIYLAAGGCKAIQVFVTDGGTRQYRLADRACIVPRHEAEEMLSFDLSSASVPFEILAVRLLMKGDVRPEFGFEPVGLCARIRKEPTKTE